MPKARPWIALSEEGRTLVAIPGTLKDCTWQTINCPDTSDEYVSRVADEIITADGKEGEFVRTLDSGDGTHIGVFFDDIVHLALPAHTGGVDEAVLAGFVFKVGVDGVTGGAGHIGDDDALLTQNAVDQRGLAAAAESGHDDKTVARYRQRRSLEVMGLRPDDFYVSFIHDLTQWVLPKISFRMVH